MSYASNDEIRGVLISAGAERVLLPNATVAEMMSRVPVQAVADAPRWLVGEIGWHGWQVPLVSFARLSGLGEETVAGHNKVVVLKTLNGNPPTEVVVPEKGVLAGVYVQGISAYAPHPNAAKLWMEHIYSDEGQIGYLKGYCHPIRFNAMSKAGKIPQDLLDKLPDAAAYEKAIFPTLEQIDAAQATITKEWDSVVGANVK